MLSVWCGMVLTDFSWGCSLCRGWWGVWCTPGEGDVCFGEREAGPVRAAGDGAAQRHRHPRGRAGRGRRGATPRAVCGRGGRGRHGGGTRGPRGGAARGGRRAQRGRGDAARRRRGEGPPRGGGGAAAAPRRRGPGREEQVRVRRAARRCQRRASW